MEQLVSLCKRRGFIFGGSEIYGGLQGTFDYGPLGVELKNNLKKLWWKHNVYERDDMEGIDCSILMNRWVWKYSGHEDTFVDPLVDCKTCKGRFRADKLQDGSKMDVKMANDPGPGSGAGDAPGAGAPGGHKKGGRGGKGGKKVSAE